MKFKFVIATVLIAPSMACNILTSKEVAVSFPTAKITTNFDGPTGFKLSDHTDAVVNVTVSDRTKNSQIKCRTGLKRSISSVSWEDCSNGKTLIVSAHSPSAHQSGTFVAQAQVQDLSGEVVSETSKEYYVHPSLDDVAECTGGESEASLFAKAGALLDQTSEFGNESVMDGPHYKIKLSNKDRALEFVSFRKKLVMNDSKTMVMLKRKFVRPSNGECIVYGKAVGSISNFHWILLANGDIKQSSSYYQQRNKGVWEARQANVYSSVLDQTVYGAYTWFINIKNSLISKQDVFTVSGLKSSRHSYARSGWDTCSAYVINAQGSAVCIDSTSNTAYLIPTKLGAFANMNGRPSGSKKSLVASSDAAIAAGADQTLRKDLNGGASNFDVYYED